jgi:hypothetical protein
LRNNDNRGPFVGIHRATVGTESIVGIHCCATVTSDYIIATIFYVKNTFGMSVYS